MSVSPRGGLKIEENRDLEQSLNFERYRDIIEHKRELRTFNSISIPVVVTQYSKHLIGSDSDVLQKVFHDIEEQDFKLYNKTAPTHRELEKQKARYVTETAFDPIIDSIVLDPSRSPLINQGRASSRIWVSSTMTTMRMTTR